MKHWVKIRQTPNQPLDRHGISPVCVSCCIHGDEVICHMTESAMDVSGFINNTGKQLETMKQVYESDIHLWSSDKRAEKCRQIKKTRSKSEYHYKKSRLGKSRTNTLSVTLQTDIVRMYLYRVCR